MEWVSSTVWGPFPPNSAPTVTTIQDIYGFSLWAPVQQTGMSLDSPEGLKMRARFLQGPAAGAIKVHSIILRRVPGQRQDWLHIAEIVALDSSNQPVPLFPVRGEPMGEWAGKYPLANAVNGRLEEFAHVDWAPDAMMEFAPVGGPRPIKSILVFNVSGLTDRFRDTRVDIRAELPDFPGVNTMSFSRCAPLRGVA